MGSALKYLRRGPPTMGSMTAVHGMAQAYVITTMGTTTKASGREVWLERSFSS